VGLHFLVPRLALKLRTSFGYEREIDVPHRFGAAKNAAEKPNLLDIANGDFVIVQRVNARKKVINECLSFR
jgi:hypothetical protein